MIPRRTFIQKTSLAGAAALLLPGCISNLKNPLKTMGIQLFTVPLSLSADVRSGLEQLAAMGFNQLELFGPYPFSDPANIASWKAVTPMLGFDGSGYFGLSQTEFLNLARTLGFSIPSMHTDLATLENNMDALAEAAHAAGATYLVLPSIPEEYRKDLDGYRSMADRFNKIGEKALERGVRFAYHNHGYGLKEKEGITPIDLIFSGTDPQSVFFEMDIFWTMAGGADPVSLMEKHPNRYKMMHLKDMKEQVYFAEDGDNPSEWIPLFPYMCSAGQGVVDWDRLITVAKTSGVEHFFVEQDMVANPEIALPQSIEFLSKRL